MSIFARPKAIETTANVSNVLGSQGTWFLLHIKQEETAKLKALEKVNQLERAISNLIAAETQVALQRNPQAKQVELNVSQKLKGLLIEQAKELELAAKEARNEAKLEVGIYKKSELPANLNKLIRRSGIPPMF